MGHAISVKIPSISNQTSPGKRVVISVAPPLTSDRVPFGKICCKALVRLAS